ncbi:hypothetical protein H0H92_010101 [Tricholoma furcatifolium]|nr:hypothetical protein H0H92_010101 [Tricholoma furcatifolium]
MDLDHLSIHPPFTNDTNELDMDMEPPRPSPSMPQTLHIDIEGTGQIGGDQDDEQPEEQEYAPQQQSASNSFYTSNASAPAHTKHVDFKYQLASCSALNLFGKHYLDTHGASTKETVTLAFEKLTKEERAKWEVLRKCLLEAKNNPSAEVVTSTFDFLPPEECPKWEHLRDAFLDARKALIKGNTATKKSRGKKRAAEEAGADGEGK